MELLVAPDDCRPLRGLESDEPRPTAVTNGSSAYLGRPNPVASPLSRAVTVRYLVPEKAILSGDRGPIGLVSTVWRRPIRYSSTLPNMILMASVDTADDRE